MCLAPKCFISYSHDNQEHKKWVLNLAIRLRKNGVNAILDQWDLRLGGDIPTFIERLKEVDRVICVCSKKYTSKADNSKGGVGYEKMLLTARLMANSDSEKIIPIIKNNALKSVPAFLETKRRINFDSNHEDAYSELISEIHGESIKSCPVLGKNPFNDSKSPIVSSIASSSSQYLNSSLTGKVEFDYDNNNGCFTIGSGSMQFDLKFSSADNTSIHVYNDPVNIERIALAYEVSSFSDITDASIFDDTSRIRTPNSGEFVIIVNKNGFFLAVKLGVIKVRGRRSERSSVSFEYKINRNKGSDFE
ncbi:hypothetical protein [uncultured Gammaproteobacteria bacterium]|nr:hypothetical protein [uncultured Gammaproteobacteria bacterium]